MTATIHAALAGEYIGGLDPWLRALVRSPRPQGRANAANVLARRALRAGGHPDARAWVACVLAARVGRERDPAALAGILRALALLGPDAAPAARRIPGALNDLPGDADVLAAAAGLLAEIGPAAGSAVLELLGHSDGEVRQLAAWLAGVTDCSILGVAELTAALDSADDTTRCGAAWSLGQAGATAAPVVGKLLRMAHTEAGKGKFVARIAARRILRATE